MHDVYTGPDGCLATAHSLPSPLCLPRLQPSTVVKEITGGKLAQYVRENRGELDDAEVGRESCVDVALKGGACSACPGKRV